MTINTETALQTASELMSHWGQSSSNPEPNRLDVIISRTNLLDAVKTIMTARWGFLSAITGLDHLKLPAAPARGSDVPEDTALPEIDRDVPSLEVLYHFCHGAAVLTLRIMLTRVAPSVPSICELIPSASLYERELSEMFGIEVLGTPDPSHLLLPDDWPNGVYPLRKDFTSLKQTAKETGKDAN